MIFSRMKTIETLRNFCGVFFLGLVVFLLGQEWNDTVVGFVKQLAGFSFAIGMFFHAIVVIRDRIEKSRLSNRINVSYLCGLDDGKYVHSGVTRPRHW